MSQSLRMEERRLRRLRRNRAKIHGTSERPRLSVTRSLAHVYAQVIDDTSGTTIAAARDADIPAEQRTGKAKREVAELVGKLVGARALERGVKQVVFDRRDKKYHGRIQAVAEGARAAGLAF